jgi:hypothetical protein
MGLADTFWNPPAAAADFAAAEMFGVVAALAGGAALGMGGVGNGGGGGSPSTFAQNGGQSNTSGSGQRGTVAVRGFADGGLVTGPTLALIGEKRGSTEAVLPLDNHEAMARIGKAVAEHVMAAGGGAGGGVTINLPHGSIISADVMQKFVGKMNKMVERGQLNVTASNSLRVTKRSA